MSIFVAFSHFLVIAKCKIAVYVTARYLSNRDHLFPGDIIIKRAVIISDHS